MLNTLSFAKISFLLLPNSENAARETRNVIRRSSGYLIKKKYLVMLKDTIPNPASRDLSYRHEERDERDLCSQGRYSLNQQKDAFKQTLQRICHTACI